MSLAFTPETILFPQLSTGTVEQTISSTQPGRVKFQATYWPAQFYLSDYKETLDPNELVAVVGRQGLNLLVVPFSYTSSDQSQNDTLDSQNNESTVCKCIRRIGSFVTMLIS